MHHYSDHHYSDAFLFEFSINFLLGEREYLQSYYSQII